MAQTGKTGVIWWNENEPSFCHRGAFMYEWTQNGDDGGASVVNWSLQAGNFNNYLPHNTYGKDKSNCVIDYRVTINGVDTVGTANYNPFTDGTKTIASGSFTIPHNYDGNKSFAVDCRVDQVNTWNSATDWDSWKDTISLPYLKIASRVLCPTVNIGTAPTMTIEKQSSNYTNTLSYTFGSQAATIVTKTSATTYSDFAWPHSFYAEIPSARFGIGVITCETYDGDELIGTSHAEFTANVNEASSTPTIFPTIRDTNAATIALTGDSNTLVRYASVVSIDIGAEARNYATLKSQICANGSKAITTATGTINGVEQAKFACSATDSRGYTTTISMTKPFVEYILLTCNMGGNLPDTSGNMHVECTGSYWAGNFGVAANTLVVQYRYKAEGGTYGDWVNMTANISGNSYTASAELSGLDYTVNYIFQARATDKLMTAQTGENNVITLPVFHWSKDDFVFEVPVTFKKGVEGLGDDESTIYSEDGTIDSDVRVTGDLRLKSEYDWGNTLYFGDGDYCYLRENTDDDLTIKATDLNFDVTNLYLKGNPISYGSWTPAFITSAAINSYSRQSGWYMRIGNVVTIGFYVNALCNSGYHTTTLGIGGLPFKPHAAVNSSFGGGVMYGAYINAGFCFEAWAVNTDGVIMPRIQPCNNTSAGNLNISSTAYYPSGANTLTCGGTISFLIG